MAVNTSHLSIGVRRSRSTWALKKHKLCNASQSLAPKCGSSGWEPAEQMSSIPATLKLGSRVGVEGGAGGGGGGGLVFW